MTVAKIPIDDPPAEPREFERIVDGADEGRALRVATVEDRVILDTSALSYWRGQLPHARAARDALDAAIQHIERRERADREEA